jgi:fructose-1,6-bisphosphatase/inositol monophosphatase family enzyme
VIEPDEDRRRLCALGDAIRDEVVRHRLEQGVAALSVVTGRVEADVLYAVDRVTEDRVRAWLDEHWPAGRPVRLVMEGIDDHETVIAPTGARPADADLVLVIDPVDGTRNLMYDKRPAWALTALAEARSRGIADRPEARFPDIAVTAMTEIPVTKQWRADQLSAVRGRGPAGVVAEGVDVRSGDRLRLPLIRPSAADHLDHGFASFANYLPDGKALLGAIAQDVLDRLMGPGPDARQIFEDQYICSAGQLHEVMTGRDRLLGDLRPLVLAGLGLDRPLQCHPYDICTALVLEELGGVFEDPWGRPVDVPLDTTTPVAWMAYANPALAALVRPVVIDVLADHLG